MIFPTIIPIDYIKLVKPTFLLLLYGMQTAPRIPTSYTNGGLSINELTCPAGFEPRLQVEQAITDAKALLSTALNAVKTPDRPPFSDLFVPSNDAEVARILRAALDSLQLKTGPAIDVYCSDFNGECTSYKGVTDLAALGDMNGAIALTPGRAAIMFCPSALALPPLPAPCTKPSKLVLTLGSLLVHEMMHSSTLTNRLMYDYANGFEESHALLSEWPTVRLANPDSYALLAQMAWQLGLGGPQYEGGPCVKEEIQSLETPTPFWKTAAEVVAGLWNQDIQH